MLRFNKNVSERKGRLRLHIICFALFLKCSSHLSYNNFTLVQEVDAELTCLASLIEESAEFSLAYSG